MSIKAIGHRTELISTTRGEKGCDCLKGSTDQFDVSWGMLSHKITIYKPCLCRQASEFLFVKTHDVLTVQRFINK